MLAEMDLPGQYIEITPAQVVMSLIREYSDKSGERLWKLAKSFEISRQCFTWYNNGHISTLKPDALSRVLSKIGYNPDDAADIIEQRLTEIEGGLVSSNYLKPFKHSDRALLLSGEERELFEAKRLKNRIRNKKYMQEYRRNNPDKVIR